jgi:hypothetical protein
LVALFPGGSDRQTTNDDLARKFRRSLQEQTDLIDWGVNKDWIKENFPLFCRSLDGKTKRPPRYEAFANRLAKVMKRGVETSRKTASGRAPLPSTGSPTRPTSWWS